MIKIQPFRGTFEMHNMDSSEEIKVREQRGENTLKFGIKFLDDATEGIFPSDLILIGARSGAGKTQMCCEILDANMKDGKKVLYVALEAGPREIESRLKYKLFMKHMRANYQTREAANDIGYTKWFLGRHLYQYPVQENLTHEEFKVKYKNAFIEYKAERYGVKELIETISGSYREVDLIIIDHIHYFDSDDENENRALKQISQTARMLALEKNKPIILIAHIRKADKKNKDLAPDMDEFHGSSDLYKIATKVITLAPGKNFKGASRETFIRVPKDRFSGGYGHFVGQVYYCPNGGGYEDSYETGWANKDQFEALANNACPKWARKEVKGTGNSEALYNYATGKSLPHAND